MWTLFIFWKLKKTLLECSDIKEVVKKESAVLFLKQCYSVFHKINQWNLTLFFLVCVTHLVIFFTLKYFVLILYPGYKMKQKLKYDLMNHGY